MTAESESIIAATLANGGTCPITAEKVMKPESVKNVLSLMLSCGLYNYSGDFAFKVGLPGKSGVSGALILGNEYKCTMYDFHNSTDIFVNPLLWPFCTQKAP